MAVTEPLPPGYVDKIHHPTSVKTIFVVRRPTETEPGIADFRFNPVFSVFDFGTLEPPVPLDNSTIALMAAYNFEFAEVATDRTDRFVASGDDDAVLVDDTYDAAWRQPLEI